MIIYCVADLSVQHDVLHSTFTKETLRFLFPVIFLRNPQMSSLLHLKRQNHWFLPSHHESIPWSQWRMQPGSCLERLMNLPVILMECCFRSLLPWVPLGSVLIAVGDFLTSNPMPIRWTSLLVQACTEWHVLSLNENWLSSKDFYDFK